MGEPVSGRGMVDPAGKAGYELAFVDAFRGYQPTTPRPAGPAQLGRA